jgi:hypothetical protein
MPRPYFGADAPRNDTRSGCETRVYELADPYRGQDDPYNGPDPHLRLP